MNNRSVSEPKYLLVPTNLKHDAIRLTRGAQLIVAGGDATTGVSPTFDARAEMLWPTRA